MQSIHLSNIDRQEVTATRDGSEKINTIIEERESVKCLVTWSQRARKECSLYLTFRFDFFLLT